MSIEKKEIGAHRAPKDPAKWQDMPDKSDSNMPERKINLPSRAAKMQELMDLMDEIYKLAGRA